MEAPKHYDNSKGTLYKVASERNWNPYLFDIVKRLERAEKKGEFKTDLEKSILVINLWLTEKELKIAAKQCNLQIGLIEYLILKVRENQQKTQTK